MSKVSLRSTHGCWTCRVRRKKCDETHPVCKLCESLHISCYGYSSDRPEWMDNGRAEKAMIDNLKSSVRLKARRRRTLPTNTLASLQSSSLARFPLPSSPDNHTRNQQCGLFKASSAVGKPLMEIFPASQEREPGLIMHFFDNVFPLQYPGYRALIEEGGRGWYLSLAFSNRVFYHATLCLSAYHREMTMRQNESSSQGFDLRDLEMHNTLSFKVLQQLLQDNTRSMTLKQRIGMLAGIIQMMFFQLLFSHDDEWRVHLEILITMIDDVHAEVLRLLHSNNPTKMTCDEIPAFLFFCGFLIWVDLQSCISMGKAPRLSKLHDQVLNEFPTIFRLHNIIGCESWVLQIISRIANIHEQKKTQGMVGKIETIDPHKTSKQIRDDLHQGLEETQKELQNNLDLPARSHLQTTQIFALAAMTYLHVTISGPRTDLREIQVSVDRTIHALKELSDRSLLKVLHWPLYLTGCVAIGENREYILSQFSTLHLLYSGACPRDRYSQMLKQYWAAREEKLDCDMWASDAARPLFI